MRVPSTSSSISGATTTTGVFFVADASATLSRDLQFLQCSKATSGPHLEMDVEKGHLVEKEALLQTPESLYNMTDPDFMYEVLKDDLMLQMTLFCRATISKRLISSSSPFWQRFLAFLPTFRSCLNHNDGGSKIYATPTPLPAHATSLNKP